MFHACEFGRPQTRLPLLPDLTFIWSFQSSSFAAALGMSLWRKGVFVFLFLNCSSPFLVCFRKLTWCMHYLRVWLHLQWFCTFLSFLLTLWCKCFSHHRNWLFKIKVDSDTAFQKYILKLNGQIDFSYCVVTMNLLILY